MCNFVCYRLYFWDIIWNVTPKIARPYSIIDSIFKALQLTKANTAFVWYHKWDWIGFFCSFDKWKFKIGSICFTTIFNVDIICRAYIMHSNHHRFGSFFLTYFFVQFEFFGIIFVFLFFFFQITFCCCCS